MKVWRKVRNHEIVKEKRNYNNKIIKKNKRKTWESHFEENLSHSKNQKKEIMDDMEKII